MGLDVSSASLNLELLKKNLVVGSLSNFALETVTTCARGPIIPSRDPILIPVNSELTELKMESTRD